MVVVELPPMNKYPVTIEHIYVSAGHNYFGKPKDGPAGHATHDLAHVVAHAGLGLQGDRYFAVPAHYNAQVTFVSAEVLDEVQKMLGLPLLDPVRTRRNLVLRGVPLLSLIGVDFTLESGGESVQFSGASHCAPCAWMDAMIAEGARTALRGRGGLRARILSDGTIHRGAAMLYTEAVLDVDNVLAPQKLPALP